MNTKGSDMSWFERPMKAVVTIDIICNNGFCSVDFAACRLTTLIES